MDFKTTYTVAVLCRIHFVHYSPYSGQTVLFCFFFFNNKMYSFTSLSCTTLFLQLQRPFPFSSCHIPFFTFFSLIKYECSSLCSFPLSTDQNQAPTLHTPLLPLFLFTPFGLQSLNFPQNNLHSSSCYTLVGKKSIL